MSDVQTTPSAVRAVPPAVDGAAIASALLAVAAVVSSGWAPVAILLAVVAVVAALVSRRSLRADPELRGGALSLGAFLLAAGTLVVIAGPPLISGILFPVATLLG